MLAGARRQADPARHQDSKDVAVREQGDVAGCAADPRDDAIDAGADLRRRFAPRTAVAKEHPARLLVVDLLGREALVRAVVPLVQIGLERPAGAEAGELTRLAGPAQRARQNELEGLLGQRGSQAPGDRTPVLGERDVGDPGVLPAQAPLRLAVANHVDLLCAGCHDGVRSQKSEAVSGRARVRVPFPLTPQRHSRISGMSSPCRAMYCLCSIRLSPIACLALAARALSCGTRSMTSSTRWKRSTSLSTTMSKCVVVVPSSL